MGVYVSVTIRETIAPGCDGREVPRGSIPVDIVMRYGGSTLQDCSMKWQFTVRENVKSDVRCTLVFSEEGDIVWITSERRNMILDPFDPKTLVLHSQIRGLGL